MTPELSRRLARAINAVPDGELSWDDRFRFATEAEKCHTFAELPQWIKDIVERTETR